MFTQTYKETMCRSFCEPDANAALMWQSRRLLCSVNGCPATKGALRSLRRPRCHSNLKTDDKVFDPLLLCSLLRLTKCNKILLSPASVQSLVEYLSLCSGSCPPPPHMGELCRGMLDTCLPRIPSLKGQLCVLGLTSPPYLLSDRPKWCRSNAAELLADYTTALRTEQRHSMGFLA